MPFYGKIDLFRSQKKLYYLKDKKFLGWHPYAVKGVVIHEVDGDHDHMILDDDDPSREEFYKIMDAYINAFKKYEVMPFYGKIDLFRSQKKLYYLKDKKFLGWHPYAVKGVVIHEVDGDHDHMILGEYSEGFAHKLQRAINRSLKIHS